VNIDPETDPETERLLFEARLSSYKLLKHFETIKDSKSKSKAHLAWSLLWDFGKPNPLIRFMVYWWGNFKFIFTGKFPP